MKKHRWLLSLFPVLGILVITEPTHGLVNIPVDYPTIQEGLNNALPGETVLVQPGTWHEHLMLDLDKEYDLQGIDANTTIIDGEGTGAPITIHTESTVTISHLTFQNSDSNGLYINGLNFDSTVTIAGCTVRNNPADGIHFNGGSYFTGFTWTIYDHHLAVMNSESYDNGGHGCYTHFMLNLVFNDNEMMHNGGDGLHFEGYSGTYGISGACRAPCFFSIAITIASTAHPPLQATA